jgi:hypothetical protein
MRAKLPRALGYDPSSVLIAPILYALPFNDLSVGGLENNFGLMVWGMHRRSSYSQRDDSPIP